MFVALVANWKTIFSPPMSGTSMYFCLSETKRSSYDLTDLPGYVPKFRPCRNKGYALCGIHGLVSFVNELVHWLRFDKKLLGFEIILGSLYLPHKVPNIRRKVYTRI